MRIKSGFIVREIMDEYIVVPVGQRVTDFNGLITLNESGVLLWNMLKDKECEPSELVDALLEEYEIDRETATTDVGKFITVLKHQELLEEAK